MYQKKSQLNNKICSKPLVQRTRDCCLKETILMLYCKKRKGLFLLKIVFKHIFPYNFKKGVLYMFKKDKEKIEEVFEQFYF